MKAKFALMALLAAFFALSAQCASATEVSVTLTSNWHYELNSTTQHGKENWVNFIGDDDNQNKYLAACDGRIYFTSSLISEDDESIPWTNEMGQPIQVKFDADTCNIIYKK